MQKLTLAAVISAFSATVAHPAFSTPITCDVGGGSNNGLVYTTESHSNGISVAASSTTAVYYVNSASSASNPSDLPFTLVTFDTWCIDQSSGAFNGNIVYGNYKTQTNVTGTLNRNGRQTFYGVNQAFSGTGTWGTNGAGAPTLSYSFFNATVNHGGASVQTQTTSSCANGGGTPMPPTVCSVFSATSQDWEGLDFLFTFDATKYSFTGTLTGTNTSGSGTTRNTATISWNIEGIDPPAEVPVPTAAWLFSSGLVGLAGAARRRSKKM